MDETMFSRMAERYGQTVILCREREERAVKAFFQPIKEKSDGEVPTVLGNASRGAYLYLGVAEEELEDVEELRFGDRAFVPTRHRDIVVGDRIFYRWAIFRERDGGRL